MRAKWSAPIRKYWKISEQMMVKYCDLAICDSVNIEKYIHIGVDKLNYDCEVDTLVIGSDEVFNCLQPYPVGYSKQLFGDGYISLQTL